MRLSTGLSITEADFTGSIKVKKAYFAPINDVRRFEERTKNNKATCEF